MLDENSLRQYIDNFYGFGDWGNKDNPIWYIGIEEGGGKSERDVQIRLDSWLRYRKDLIGNDVHHAKINKNYFEKGKYQFTWARLIALRLSYEDKPMTSANRKEVQMNNWGHLDSNNLLIELFPLPSPKNSTWNYGKWTKSISFLKTRKTYYDYIGDKRIKIIKSKIEKYKPKIVVLYGDTMKEYWDKLTDTKLQSKTSKLDDVKIHKEKETYFFQTPHPASWKKGVSSYDYWGEIGQLIKKTCS